MVEQLQEKNGVQTNYFIIMKIDKKQLQEALTVVKPGLASKDFIEQATCFAFIDGRVVTYNDEISISHPVPGVELQGAIDAKELYTLLGHIRKDEVTLEESENSIILKAGRSKAGFTLYAEVTLPLNEVTGKKKWMELPDGFTDALYTAALTCSKDQSRPVLTCVHVHKDGFIEGSDSQKVSRTNFDSGFSFNTFLLPATSAQRALAISPTHIALTDGWAHFTNEKKTVLSARILGDDAYVNTDPLLALQPDTFIRLPKRLTTVLERAQSFYNRGSYLEERVELLMESGKATIKAQSESSNWFEESMKCDGTAELSIEMPPALLKDILDADVEIGVTDKILKIDKNNWQYICAYISK